MVALIWLKMLFLFYPLMSYYHSKQYSWSFSLKIHFSSNFLDGNHHSFFSSAWRFEVVLHFSLLFISYVWCAISWLFFFLSLRALSLSLSFSLFPTLYPPSFYTCLPLSLPPFPLHLPSSSLLEVFQYWDCGCLYINYINSSPWWSCSSSKADPSREVFGYAVLEKPTKNAGFCFKTQLLKTTEELTKDNKELLGQSQRECRISERKRNTEVSFLWGHIPNLAHLNYDFHSDLGCRIKKSKARAMQSGEFY